MSLLEAFHLLAPITAISQFKQRFDDDFIDRLNNRYSLFLFIIMGIICGAREFYEPMNCWSPAQFTPYWADYTNKVCWISNTYYVPFGEDIPPKGERKEQMIAYYQWVPLMILCQAVFFFAPSIIWKKLNAQSGIHVNKIVSKVREAENGSLEVQEKNILSIVRNLDRALRSQQDYRTGILVRCLQSLSKTCFFICGKRYGNFLTVLYLFVKLLYIANAIGQLFLLNAFLGDGYHLYGFNIASDIVSGRNWTTSRRFPRVTLCDFEIRSLGNRVHDYVVQCALPINLFNEKVYIFIWFWLFFISGITTINLIQWMWNLFRINRIQYVKKSLKIMRRNFKIDDNTPSKAFCEDYLRQDGIFVLRLIAKNTNDVVVGEIIQAMWDYYKHHQKARTNEV